MTIDLGPEKGLAPAKVARFQNGLGFSLFPPSTQEINIHSVWIIVFGPWSGDKVVIFKLHSARRWVVVLLEKQILGLTLKDFDSADSLHSKKNPDDSDLSVSTSHQEKH